MKACYCGPGEMPKVHRLCHQPFSCNLWPSFLTDSVVQTYQTLQMCRLNKWFVVINGHSCTIDNFWKHMIYFTVHINLHLYLFANINIQLLTCWAMQPHLNPKEVVCVQACLCRICFVLLSLLWVTGLKRCFEASGVSSLHKAGLYLNTCHTFGIFAKCPAFHIHSYQHYSTWPLNHIPAMVSVM